MKLVTSSADLYEQSLYHCTVFTNDIGTLSAYERV